MLPEYSGGLPPQELPRVRKIPLIELRRNLLLETEFYNPEQFIVIVGNKRLSEDLADFLQQYGITTQYLHTEICPESREQIERDFSDGRIQVLTVPKSFIQYMPPFGRIPRVRLVIQG